MSPQPFVKKALILFIIVPRIKASCFSKVLLMIWQGEAPHYPLYSLSLLSLMQIMVSSRCPRQIAGGDGDLCLDCCPIDPDLDKW